FKDGRDERFDDGQGPWDADARVAAGESGDQRMTGRDRRRVLVEAEKGRDVGERPVRTRPPRFCLELVTGVDEGDGGRPVEGPGRTPGTARREADRGVVQPSPQRCEGQAEIER